MSWQRDDSGVLRWSWEADTELHLLVHANGELRELHDRTVHIYVPDEAEPDNDAPLASAKHVRTVAVPNAPTNEADAFTWLEQGRYDGR